MENKASAAGRIFALCLLGLLAATTLAIAAIYWQTYGYAKLFGDFATFQAAARHITAGEMSAVYDIATLKGLLASGGLKAFGYFLNPPTGLFVVWPLAFFSKEAGLVFWSISQLALLAVALGTGYSRRMFAPTDKGVSTPLLLAVTFFAFALQNIFFGQVAALCTSLFLLVMGLRATRPVLAGVILGIFSFKPQLGLLLPLLLLAELNIRALVSAFATAALLAALSIGFWGFGLWQDYAQMLALRSEFILAQEPSLLFVISSSVFAAIRNLGVSATASMLCQTLTGIGIAVWLWPVLRRGSEPVKLSLVALGALLVTPYSLVYDMALLAIPCALLLRRAETGSATRLELIALMLLVLMPLLAVLLQIAHIPYCVLATGFAFAAIRLESRKEG